MRWHWSLKVNGVDSFATWFYRFILGFDRISFNPMVSNSSENKYSPRQNPKFLLEIWIELPHRPLQIPRRRRRWMENGLISVDRWSDGSQIYFLTHMHSDHTKGLSSQWSKGPLFCSRLTAKLFPFKFPKFNFSLLRVLEIGLWHSISLISPSSGSRKVIKVMAIDAHHCPGNQSFKTFISLFDELIGRCLF